MKRILWIGLAAVAAIAGCVPSIHGIATKENTVWDENLIGRWGDADKADDPNAEVWQFEKGKEDSRYTLRHKSDGKVGEFHVTMVQLSNMLFLDIFPGEDGSVENANDLYKMHLIAAHTFMKVDELGKTLKMRMMDPDEVKKLVEENPALVKHEMREDQVILTAGPEELQGFLVQYADRIFGEGDGDAMVKISAGE